MSFNDNFLKQQADPYDLAALVQKQGSLIRQIGQSFVRVQALDEMAVEIGNLDYRAIDANGKLRMIMSAINLFNELGVDAHFAGIDTDGVVQFYVNADNGKLYAGGGAIVQGEDGININDAGDSITFFDQSTNTYVVFSMTINPNIGGRVLRLLNADVVDLTNRIANGDFETGDFTSWSETDPDGKISISSLGQGYGGGYAAFFNNASFTNYLSQTITTASAGLFVRFRLKTSGNAAVIINDITVLSELNTQGVWRTFHIFVPGSTSTFKLSVNGGTGHYVDDITVLAIEGSIPKTSFMDFGSGVVSIRSGIFQVGELASGNNPAFSINTNSGSLKVTVNSGGNDMDVNMLGDNDFDLFYLDAGNDRIGIGTNTPAHKLDVVGGEIAKNGVPLGQVMGGHGLVTTVPASSTNYLHPFLDGLLTAIRNALITKPGTCHNLYITTGAAQPASGSLVVTMMKNGVATAITITIAAGAAAGTYSDTTHSFAVAAGDTVRVDIVNNATSASASIGAWAFEFRPG